MFQESQPPPLPSSGRYGKRETYEDIINTNLIYEIMHQAHHLFYTYYEYDDNGNQITRTGIKTAFF